MARGTRRVTDPEDPMSALRNAWATITRQLGALSGKDKALIGSLVIVGIMALVLVALWSAKPTLVPLLPDMGPTEQAAAETTLAEADIEHTTKGGKVYVTPDKRMYALAYLQQAGKLPENTQSLFAALLKGQNWMSSSRDGDRLANAALCEVLSGVITNFRGVERATVMIDAPESNGIGTAYRKPTASVGVLMKAGKTMDRDMVDAIAAMVAGAKAGLSMDGVRVIDQRNGRQFSGRAASALEGAGVGASESYIDLVMKHEASIQRKVSEVVNRIDPLSIVTVSVQADNTLKQTTTDKYFPEGKGSVGVMESSTKDESNDKSSGGGGGNGGTGGAAAPGVTSNLPASINDGSGSGGNASTKTTSNDKMAVGLGKTHEVLVAPGGMPTRVSVMVSLSREYMINLIKTKKGPAAAGAGGAGGAASDEPTQADIDTAFLAEKKRMETDLTPVVQTAAVETTSSAMQRVTVSLIPVMQLGMAGIGGGGGGGVANMASAGGGGGGLMAQLGNGQTIRTAFLGVLACVALGMMLMLVRKSAKPQKLPSPEELAGLPPVMEAGDDVVGEADEGATAMVGIELGEDQIKTKKMLESIEELVKKTPLDAAALMNRWLNVER
jgi:flagellar biosynthesis/type III secretory pathway M-ring protein FliF/YscJ